MAESDLQWVVTGYALTFGGFLLLGGRAADLLGRRRILLAWRSFTLASLGCGLATRQEFLILMRCLQGLDAAIVLPAALSIVMDMFPEAPRSPSSRSPSRPSPDLPAARRCDRPVRGPVTFLLIRRHELAQAVASTTLKEPKPVPASAG